MSYRRRSGGLPAPALPLDFINAPDSALSRVTFSRGSSTTRFDATGAAPLTVLSNVGAIDFDPSTHAPLGLSMWPSATNLLLNSLIDGTSLSTQTVAVSAVAYTLSFYGTGTITLSGASTSGPLVGSAVYPTRSTLTFTPSASNLTLTVTGTVQYAQLETGSFATPFIPTAGTALTRAVDTCSIAVSLIPGFSASFGTLVVVGDSADSVPSSRSIAGLDDGTGNNRIVLFRASNGRGSIIVNSGGTTQANIDTNSSSWPVNTVKRLAGSWSVNDFAFIQAGALIGTDSSGSIPTVTTLKIGAGGNLNGWCGHIQQVILYGQRLSNTQDQVMAYA